MPGSRRLLAEWPVWVGWVLVSASGGMAGFILALTVLGLLGMDVQRALDEVITFGLFWTGIGTGQWLVLRRRTSVAGWWIAACALGGALVGAGAGILGNDVNLALAYIGAGALLGVLSEP